MEEEQKCKCPAGIPAWVLTFADLMSLLMCFFVLLLSFAEMDIQKYKTLSGSMAFAFGVQREVEADAIPKGTSIIAQNFSPGSPRQTITNEIRQDTTNEIKDNLEFSEGESDGKKRSNSEDNQQKSDIKEETTLKEDLAAAQRLKEIEQAELEEEAEEIEEKLKDEIAEDLLEVEVDEGKIVIRIKEKGSFPSGRAELRPGFSGVMDKLREVVLESKRDVLVAGHTDSRSIRSRRFRSNWELSAARAVSVVHELLKGNKIERERIMVQGHADSQALVDNKTPENRSKNRRVEIVLVKGKDKERIRKLEDVNKAPEKKKPETEDEEADDEWGEGEDDAVEAEEAEDAEEGDEDAVDEDPEEDIEIAPAVDLTKLYKETSVDDEVDEESVGDEAFEGVDSLDEAQTTAPKTQPNASTANDAAAFDADFEPQASAPTKTAKPSAGDVDWGDWPEFPEEKAETNQ